MLLDEKKKMNKKKERKEDNKNKQVGPPVNGCRGIISNHHRNITSDLCTSKPRRKNITQLVIDVTLNLKDSGNDARRSKRPGEKKQPTFLSQIRASRLTIYLFLRFVIPYFSITGATPFFQGTGTRKIINRFYFSLNCY